MEGTAAAGRNSAQTATGMMLSAMLIAASFRNLSGSIRAIREERRQSTVVQISWEYIARAVLFYEGEHPNRGVI